MIATATGVPASEPQLARASRREHAGALAHRAARVVPMRAKPSAARSPRPMRSKKSRCHPRPSCPRYVHLQTVVQSERTSTPVAR